jgi:hypothetical protein
MCFLKRRASAFFSQKLMLRLTPPGPSRVPSPLLSTVAFDLLPSKALQFTLDFLPEGPRILVFDIARHELQGGGGILV